MQLLEDSYGNVIAVKNISGVTGIYENENYVANSNKMDEKLYYFKIIAGIVWTRYYTTMAEAETYRNAVIEAMQNTPD
ncbi:hypothetical protein LOH54_02415 [Sulfurimonas sp. HSL-3221]|uniref:DUF1508 domain-containing protein n=1 Tax=Sulfurimonas diazotrophicus TaxID=3131939 RepID=A0ABZ3HBA6_9BACT|nr:hypothetical protein [Sulfurimonas sp. HSL-3221]UFS62988.1 hypothetical protein LOH54_02415 [Sulfurimonas sp. HSL-3221]